MKLSLLIVDDQQDVLAALRLALARENLDIVTATSPAGALAAVAAQSFDAALVDLNYSRDTTSGIEGIELLPKLRQADPMLQIVVLTAWATVGIAVDAMRGGASNFIEKPWDNQRLIAVLRNQLELGRALRTGRRLAAENALLREAQPSSVIAESREMQDVMSVVTRVAASSAPILITGEHGTGKSLLARTLHQQSDRSSKSLIEVNVCGLAEGVFESEMFGHVRGAFTDARSERVGRFELADGGTLFLDEIGNLSPAQQSKLLRVLETGEFEPVGSSRTRKVDVRLIAATNAMLSRLITEGRFREDLLFRINVVEIHVPPLRQRRTDIVPLAHAALTAAAQRYRRSVKVFAPQALFALQQYAWPGNIRELQHVVERAVLLAQGERIEHTDLRLERSAGSPPSLEDMSLEDADRTLIHSALKRSNGSATAAAEALGLSRSAMYRRMEKLGLRADE